MGTAVWVAVATLLLVADEFSVMLMLPELGVAFPDSDVRWLLIAFALGVALVPLWVLKTVPHWQETPVLLGSFILLALVNGAAAMLPPFGVVLVARALAGGLHGLIGMLLFRIAGRGGFKVAAALTMAWSVGIAFLLPLDAWLGTLMDWDGLISVLSGLALFVFLPATHCLPSGPSPTLTPVRSHPEAAPASSEKWLLAAELAGSAALAAPFALGVSFLRSTEGANLDLWDAAVLASFSMFGPLLVVLFRRSLLFGRAVTVTACVAALIIVGLLVLLPTALKDATHAASLIPLLAAAEYVRRLGLRGLAVRLVPAARQSAFRQTANATQQLGLAIGIAAALTLAGFREVAHLSAAIATASALVLCILASGGPRSAR